MDYWFFFAAHLFFPVNIKGQYLSRIHNMAFRVRWKHSYKMKKISRNMVLTHSFSRSSLISSRCWRAAGFYPWSVVFSELSFLYPLMHQNRRTLNHAIRERVCHHDRIISKTKKITHVQWKRPLLTYGPVLGALNLNFLSSIVHHSPQLMWEFFWF